jgi:predicted nucleotidyltransferase
MHAALYSELFGGVDRYKALRCLFEHPDRAFGPRELATEARIDPGNASRWLRRWADAGLLVRTSINRSVKYSASGDSSLEPLQRLFQQDSELAGQLREVVSSLGKRVSEAAIFGSAAKGTDTASSDVDVLLITSLSRLQAQRSFMPLARSIGRPINVVTFTYEQWAKSVEQQNPFVMELLSQPFVRLLGSVHAFAQA